MNMNENMSCDKFEKELENRGGLKALQADAAFARHRQECPVCEKKWVEHSKLFKLLQADAPPMPDESYWASFPTLVREKIEAKKSRPVWKPVLVFGTPVAVLILITGIFFFKGGTSTDLKNLTAGDAFKYAEPAEESNLDLSISENTLTSLAGEAEEEIVGRNNVEELVLSLTDEQFKKLEENLESFKL